MQKNANKKQKAKKRKRKNKEKSSLLGAINNDKYLS